MNIDVVSQLIAEDGVDALISTEPVLAIADKGLSATYKDKTFQSGDTIHIRVEDQPKMPAQSNVMQVDPIVQGEIPVTVLQYNDGVPIAGIEQEYFLGGEERIRERISRPRMKNMAVQASILCYNELGTSMNFFGTPGTPLKTAEDWGFGQALLNDQLAMDDGLYAIMSNRSMAETSGDLAKAFNPTTESATAYMKGRVKMAANLNFFSSSNIPNHLNGSAVGTGAAGMKLAVNPATGATSFTVSGGTANGTLTKNTIIWFSAVRAVQPNTKKTLSTLRYFTVAADATLDGAGAGVITTTEPVYGPENAKLQNASILPTTAQFVGVVGAANTLYEQAFVCKKNAFAFIGLPLPDLYSLNNKRASYEGVDVHVTSFGDGTNYINMIRWDILCASKIRQWRHVARAYTRAIS